jgi:hypothetical protein
MRKLVYAIALGIVVASGAGATTKGLNQIVTPDLEPMGNLSLSYQTQNAAIGNAREVQFELGLTNWAEIAIFRGLAPNTWVGNVEMGVRKGCDLYSAGFSSWTSGSGRHVDPQPFVEYGYYEGRNELMAGAIRAGRHTEAITGYADAINSQWEPMADYQSGPGNAATLGVTYTPSPQLAFDPAFYFLNDKPHKVVGYAVLTWTVRVF